MIEILAVISTLVCVYLTTRLSVWNWPVGIVGVLAYMSIFYQQGLYGQFGLQFIFLGQSLYGWYYWKKINPDKVIVITTKRFLYDIGIAVFLVFLLMFILKTYTDNKLVALDSITTIFSLLGTWYMARKIIYTWIIWLIANMFFIIMFVELKMYWSVGLYLFLILLNLKGLRKWSRNTKMVWY